MMLARLTVFILLLSGTLSLKGQGTADPVRSDSAVVLEDVNIHAYFREQPILSSPASASVISLRQLNSFNNASLVPVLNTIAGVRMEERSPGSYRLSIRGSLLRSPFGIRNVKIYYDEFALTDAGGNTYLNLADVSSISRLEILKGPEGSIFGANTGGVILVSEPEPQSQTISASLSGGSYGLFHENLSLAKGSGNYKISVNQAFQRSDGYRANSALNRKYYSVNQRLKYNSSSELRSVLLYSDLNYETPGGLTLAQSATDPRLARQPAGKIPGAEQQHAAIFNRTLFGGLLNETSVAPGLKIIAAVSGIHTDFKNPFITNFEVRKENSLNLRAFAAYRKEVDHTKLDFSAGFESQRTWSSIKNYGNRAGIRDTMQSADDLNAAQDFAFTRLTARLNDRITLEAAASLNFYAYHYRSSYPKEIAERRKRFEKQLMPRFGASWLMLPWMSARASVSRGYSAPTIAEVRASDNVINTSLQPEQGWNYETGIRIKNRLVYLDASIFSFRLKDAIVRRLNANDTEYFLNAGGTRQLGVEFSAMGWLLYPRQGRSLRSAQVTNAVAISDFKFNNYSSGPLDYSGNSLTGVPKRSVTTGLSLETSGNLRLFMQHSYVSAIPLNDANSVYAKSSHIFQARLGWTISPGHSKYSLRPFAGADNIFDVAYSLGNDLNAAGNRYFNPAAGRNYYAGLTVDVK